MNFFGTHEEVKAVSEPDSDSLPSFQIPRNFPFHQNFFQFSPGPQHTPNENENESRTIQNDENIIQNDENIIQNDENIIQLEGNVVIPKKNIEIQETPKREGICESYRQQNVQGFYFAPSTKRVLLCSAFFGFLLAGFGALFIGDSNGAIEVEIDYTSHCPMNMTCTVPVTFSLKMPSPVFIYIELSHYYQNDRRYFLLVSWAANDFDSYSYVTSYNRKQLAGQDVPLEGLSSCGPVKTVGELYPFQQFALNSERMEPNKAANPCGLKAKSFFTDKFSLKDPSNHTININTTDIAWATDMKNYKRNKEWESTQWIDVQDERFVNWMDFATAAKWKKLWGRIEQEIGPGTYFLEVNNTYNVAEFSGNKSLLLSTATSFGGESLSLGITLSGFGVAIIVIVIILAGLRCFKKTDDYKCYTQLTFEWKN